MALTAQQICALARQEAKTPGMSSQSGQFLNATLQDLCMNYDLDQAVKLFSFNFNSATGQGSGPYTLPIDYLRTQVIDGKDNFFYTIDGVPYPLIQETFSEYNWQVQTPGFQSYPYNYSTFLPQTPGQTAGTLIVWPPASGSYPCKLYYYSLMPDIATPETSTAVPWFPNTQILIRSVAGRLMGISGDNRQEAYLGDDAQHFPLGAGTLLNSYLKNAKDREGAVKTVGLDRRRWGRPFDRLKNTKSIGWVLLFMLALGVFPVHAQTGSQKTTAQLITEVNQNFIDNTLGLITPALARQSLLDMVASFGVITPPTGLNQGLLITQSVSGTATAPQTPCSLIYGCPYNLISITSDTANFGTNQGEGLAINHVYGGSATQGARAALWMSLTQTAITSASNANRNYDALQVQSYSAVGDGGTNVGAGAKGRYYAGDFVVYLDNGAANVNSASGIEIDIGTAAGASVQATYGLNIVNFESVQGSAFDAAVSISASNLGNFGAGGPLGWKCGICWTDYNNVLPASPMSAGSSLFGTYWVSLAPPTITNGADFRGFNFSNFAFASNGFTVTGQGIITSTGPTGVGTGLIISDFAATPFQQYFRTEGTSASPAVVNNSALGNFTFNGFSGAGYTLGARMTVTSTGGAWNTASNLGSSFAFITIPAASITQWEPLYLGGDVIFGTGNLGDGGNHRANFNIPIYQYQSQTSGSTLTQGLNIRQDYSGSTGLTAQNFNLFNINDTEQSGSAFLNGWAYIYNYGGGASGGGRQAFQVALNIIGTVTNANQNWVSFAPGVYALANGGGGVGTERGYANAMNPQVILCETAGPGVCSTATAATNYQEAATSEYNISIHTGASVLNKSGVKIIALSSDKVQGSAGDSAMVFTSQSGAVGWKALITIGNYNGGLSPFAQAAAANGASVMTLSGNFSFLNGIDFNNAAPTGTDLTNGFAFRAGQSGTVKYSVDWNGVAKSASVVSIGTTPTGNTGTCNTAVTVAGGATAGTWTSTAICALGGTIILTAMPTAPTGYACFMFDRTTAGVTVEQTATTVTSATFTVRNLPTGSVATVANDILEYGCHGY